MRSSLLLSLLVVAGRLAACSSESAAPTPGAGGEAGVDATAEAAPDAGVDAPPDQSACKLLGPYSSSNPTCNACAEAECCLEVNGCLGDVQCNDDYVNCILVCALGPADAGDAAIDACLTDCGAQFPQGKSEYDVAIACAESKCPSCK